MVKARNSKFVIALTLGLLPLLYFHEAVRGAVVLLQGDGWTGNLGLRVLTAKLLTHGTLPLWNPDLFGGMPLLADVSAGVLYPAHWLFCLWPPGRASNWLVITTFHLALIGTYLYARACGCGQLGALLSSVSFAFGGYMMMSLGQSQNIAAAAWLPWLLLAIEKLYQHLTWRWLALGVCFATLQFFAGMPQLSLYAFLLIGAYVLFSLGVRPAIAPRGQFVLGISLLCLCVLLLSAIQWLPARELQLASDRAALSYAAFAEFPFPPRQLGALIIPFLHGGATMPPYRAPYAGEAGIFVTCGYVGLLAWLLALIAISGARRERLVWFWAALALAALLLAFGDHLPWQLNRLLFKLPGYQLFRASYRHMFEFTFALALLAGLGLDWLVKQAALQRRIAWRKSCAVLAVLFALALVANYRFTTPALAEPELLLPFASLCLSAGALWWLARRPNWLAKSLLLAVLGADLLAYGHALEWRAYDAHLLESLNDPPAVQFIKQREPDWTTFRMLSYSPEPFGAQYTALNFPNNSLARGLQSVNGYDMLRLTRPAEMLGQMSPAGVVTAPNAFDSLSQGFNLFNVKYLLCERAAPPNAQPLAKADDLRLNGVRFPAQPLDLHLRQRQRRSLLAGDALADEIVLVTTLANAGQLNDNAPVAEIRLRMADGRMAQLSLCAGRDTAEWSYDRADVRATVQHRRALAVESWAEEGFAGHRYLARWRFPRGAVAAVEIEAVNETGQFVLFRAVLRDSASGQSYALTPERWPAQRWQKLAEFGAVEVYENRAWLPRAWLVPECLSLPSTAVLRAITQGELPNQQPFQPVRVALVEQEDRLQPPLFSERKPAQTEAPGQVRVLRNENNEAEYATNSQQPALLVLSEVFYPGWEATLDGKPATLSRVNYALRGVPVPAGEHRVRLRFQPASVRRGALLSGLGLLLLLASFIPIRYVQRRGN